MNAAQSGPSASGMTRNLPRAHEWEMVSAFGLSLAHSAKGQKECLLEPVAAALLPVGVEDDDLLCQISSAVEAAGEELRGCCPEGKLDCINVRVHVSTQAMRSGGKPSKPWEFFVIKQMASSESDNLDSIEDPRCFIDLHVF